MLSGIGFPASVGASASVGALASVRREPHEAFANELTHASEAFGFAPQYRWELVHWYWSQHQPGHKPLRALAAG